MFTDSIYKVQMKVQIFALFLKGLWLSCLIWS